jgi:hypothetical protein
MHAKALSLSSSRRALVAGGVVLLLAGCASMNSVSVNVVSFGSWPTGRALGSYVVDRLPSQQQAGGPRLAAEAAARRALEQVGFKPAASEAQADVVVQLGVSHSKVLDPWAGWGFYGGRSAWGVGAGFGWPYRRPGMPMGPYYGPFGSPFWADDAVRDQSEVALLIIDRSSHKALYEAHARYESRIGGDSLLPSLFQATLDGFPGVLPGERRVTVPYAPSGL